MINVNVTLLIQMVNFFVFLFLMNLILYRPVRRFVAERQALIESRRAGIEGADAEAANAVSAFETGIQNARKAGRQRIQELKEEAYRHEKDLMRGATEEATRYVQGVREQIQNDVKKARDQLKNQVQAFSVELAQKVLGRSI